jgi:hypothetical protein
METTVLPELSRQSTPDWLMRAKFAHDQIPIVDLLQGSVFYPASAMDGRPVKYLGGYSHSFVYADCNVTQDSLITYLDTFKGYRLYYSRSVAREELCFKSFQPLPLEPNDGDPSSLHVWPGLSPYSIWAVYKRQSGFDEDHGPERFSLLFVGGEGAATFQSLYYSNQCSPSAIALSKCDAFTGNWTQFYNPRKILARSVIQNPHGIPDYLFCDRGPEPPWPWYPILQHTVVSVLDYDGITHQRLYLWGRDAGLMATT